MTRAIANARMYAVTPEAESAWQDLIARVSADAGVAFDYLPYPAPQPLEALWLRPDLGCVLMCGFPVATRLADVVPIAAPIPSAPWAAGAAVYRSDLIVRTESAFARFEDTFAGTVGWTVAHSHSGFNALRHHLLPFRHGGEQVFGRAVGPLVTARKVLDSVLDGTIDVGPLDAYWHLLMRRHRPESLAGLRVIASTDLAPIPAFVASPAMPAEAIDRLRAAFEGAARAPWFAPFADALCLEGFAGVDAGAFAPTLAWAREAEAAGYFSPA